MPRNFSPVYATKPRNPEKPQGGIPTQQDPSEPFVDLVSGESFKTALVAVILPYVDDIRKQLLRRPDLNEANRQRLVGSLLSIEYIATQIYKKAGEEVPVWVSSHFR